MLNSGFGDTIVSTAFSTVPTMSNGAKTLSALATTDADSNIYLAILNSSREEDYPLEVILEGISSAGATVTAQVLTTDSYAAQNSHENPNAVTVMEMNIPVGDGANVYTIPKHTFVVLKIDPAAEIDPSTVVSGFAVDPAELPTKGGEATVSITGRNLPEGILVKCGDTIVSTSGNSIRQTAVLTFPANTTEEDIVYSLSYTLDGETYEGNLTVTVAVNRYDPDDSSRDIPLSVLDVSCGDYEMNGGASEGPAYLAVDNDPSTLWHTDWYGTSRADHWFQFELSEDYIVDGLRYQPRQTGNSNGTITQYEIQVSDDGVDFQSVASGSWEGNASWKIANFGGVQVKYVRLVAVNALTDNAYVFASAAEIRLTGKKAEAPHEHSYEAVVTAPTCTEGGYTTYTCECGDSYIADETPALGHSFGEWTVTTAPTCTETGVETRTCTCGETETRVVEALGHDFVNGDCSRCDAVKGAPFEDVLPGAFYFDPVEWAVEKGITKGATENTFNPNGDLQRAQFVTMLWRAAGEPKPTSTKNPFDDVKKTDFFYDAVLWAVEENITNGSDATHFNPYGITNRAQAVTFLWRYLGQPEATATSTFTDVVAGEWYEAPINWAVGAGVTNGMSANVFGINDNCNRAQAVTFLYRALK